MSKFITNQGFTSNKALWKSIVTDLTTNGFDVVSINGTLSQSGSLPEDLTAFVIQATTSVDPLATDQPWRIAGVVTDVSVELYCATPQQITDLGVVSIIRTEQVDGKDFNVLAGCIRGSRSTVGEADAHRDFFFHKGVDLASYLGTMVFERTETKDNPYEPVSTDAIISADWSSIPMSYALSISGHGIALHTSIEGRDDEGCRQNWLCIQRAINSDGTVVTTGKAPLFALWSHNGGGAHDNSTLFPSGIRRMTVRESDVNAPTEPTSAVQHSADAFAVMNPLQQVPFSEDGRFDFRLPQGFNTQRHSYPFEIDMIGYASADVISSRIPIEIQVYGELESDGSTPKKRKYLALSANSAKNTGMRLFILKEGGGIEPEAPAKSK